MSLRLYAYCKLRGPDAGVRLAGAVADVAAATGVAARLERRVGDPATWLEVYGPMRADAAARLVDALDAAAIRHALDAEIEGGRSGRTLEWFEDEI